ncbi:MAG: hypothetical protein E7Z80_05780 [Methanobrevibacter thaueri]|nr:hypothetical protein [Methanobrevibacter thaueri]
MKKIILHFLTKIPTRYITSGLILIIILFIYGLIGSYFIMHLNFVDSIYYSIITMTTVGYGDLTPHTGIQKIFATTLALSGVALLAYVFNVLLTNFQEKMSKYSKGARKMKVINEMDDYYIICGFGRVGKVVFKELTSRKQNVIIIDKDPEICKNIEEKKNVIVINRDAIENDYIAKLAGEKCRSVILCAGDDVNNLFIVLTIRETNPDAWIVTRASKTENIKRLKKAGANKIVSPEIIGGKDLYYESARPHLLRITVKHDMEDLYEEFKIISKHKCTLETIDYHIPGIESPLSRDIKKMHEKDGKNFINYINTNEDKKQAIINLYENVNGVHSHLISGPDNATFKKLLKDLEKNEEIIGINLTNEQIVEITKETIE